MNALCWIPASRGVDSTDACLSLTVTRRKRLWKCFYADLKAPVSVSILLEISIANGAVRW